MINYLWIKVDKEECRIGTVRITVLIVLITIKKCLINLTRFKQKNK